MNGLYLKAVVNTKDFEKEMAGLGYPLRCYELPCLEYEEYGVYVPFLLTDKAVESDYESLRWAKENDYDEEYLTSVEAQIAMRRNLRAWVKDDEVLIHFTWDK